MASTYLQNPSSGASSTTERRTLTFSFWVKRGTLGSTQYMFSGYNNASYYAGVIFQSTDKLRVFQNAGGSGTEFDLITTRVFRDTSAWMHIVVAFDTTDATSSNRIKIYVNGVQETAFDTSSYPSQNHNTYFGMTSGGDGYPTYIGGTPGGSNFDGLMADVYLVGGTQYAASTFGETDSTTGEWKPNTSPTISYGSTAGVNSHLTFENASDLGEDTSGNNNDFTVAAGNAIQTQDNPSNVFATLTPLTNRVGTLTYGNNKHAVAGATNPSNCVSSLGMKSGKYYVECKLVDGGNYNGFGIVGENNLAINTTQANYLTSSTNSNSECLQYVSSTIYYPGGNVSGTYATLSTYDIGQVALDLDNGYVYFGVNGTWQNSGDPTSGSSGTGGIQLSTYFDSNTTYFFGSETGGASTTRGIEYNFGNGRFGVDAISSEGTNASGIGKFEYDVPTGYTALSTKGLNE